MVDDEGGLDELLLRHGLEDLGDELALAPSRLGMAAVFLQDGHQLSRLRSKDTSSPACSLASSIMEARRQSPDRSTGVPWYSIFRVPQAASGRGLDAALGEVHHGVEIAEGLIGLHGGELGIVVRIHALVAELTANLEHLLETAHEQALQRQLRGDAQVVVAVERVEVRDEGLRVRPADDGVQKRRLHLVVARHPPCSGGWPRRS